MSFETMNQEGELKLAKWTKSTGRSPLQEMLTETARPGIISFALGLPAPEFFPPAFAQIAEQILFNDAGALQYNPHLQPLKRQVLGLMKQRGVSCLEEQIFLTAG